MPETLWLTVPIRVAAVALIAMTLLPLAQTPAWWVRAFDFPRAQIAALLALVLLGGALALDRGSPATWLWVAALTAALLYQLVRIFPFTPLAPVQATMAESCEPDARLRLLIANVLESNRDSSRLLEMTRRLEPDVLLAMETDAWWDRELSALEGDYPHRVREPLENTYGMHLFSKLELVDPEVRHLLEDDVPSIHAGIRLRSGAVIEFHGVHPKPPDVDQDTAERDAELLIVGREVRKHGGAAIVAGDLNDVAWSRTNRLFQEISGLLDPRIGRGLFSTFNARWPLLKWPLDHVFFDETLALIELRRMGRIGSDHFPIYIALCHKPEAAARQSAPQPDAEDEQEADEAIEEGRQDAGP
jgi:endonuclease/exonuclease/phosphatase (EEP) superfamily protein YafD